MQIVKKSLTGIKLLINKNIIIININLKLENQILKNFEIFISAAVRKHKLCYITG